MPLQVLDERRSGLVRSVCELIVPGCARVGAEVYVDALLARMPDEARAGALAAFDSLEQAASGGARTLGERSLTPEFQLVRAPGPGAWQEIDFKPPLAARLDKDWSYLGGGVGE
jgi:hypothetical protein